MIFVSCNISQFDRLWQSNGLYQMGYKNTWILQLIKIWFLLTACNLWIIVVMHLLSVKNLLSKDFKHLLQEFRSEFLKLVKQKGVYPYE